MEGPDFGGVKVTGDEAVLLFVAVFWAIGFGPLAAYRFFDTHLLWDRAERKWAAKRLVAGTVLVNVLPIFVAAMMLGFLAGRDGVWAVVTAAIGSLSMFGIRRVAHAAVASEPVKWWFYSPNHSNPPWDRLPKSQNGFWRHFIPGICYMALALVPWLASGHLPKIIPDA